MEIRDLEYFLACCEAGSLTAAARRVHIVQSAMSSAIARLERDLGVPLLDRTKTPLTVTDHGAALQVAAERILDAVRQGRDEVEAVSGVVRGTVVLGSTLNTGPLDLVAVLTDVRTRYPEIVVQLRQSTTGSAGNLGALLEGSVNIALTAVGEPAPEGVAVHPLVSEPLVFVCRRDHRLATLALVDVVDLASERILRFPPGWGVRAAVDRVFGPAPSAIELADYQLTAKLVRAGFGTTLMPASALVEGHGLRTVPVNDRRLWWNLSAAVSTRRRLSAATTAVLGGLTAAVAQPGDGRAAPAHRLGR